MNIPTNLASTINLLLQFLINGIPVFQRGDAQVKEFAEKLQADIDHFNATGEDISDDRMQVYRDFADAAHAAVQGNG